MHRRRRYTCCTMQHTAAELASASTVDPITLEVIRHRLVSIANQIDANIKRTAFSPYIYEYNDFAVGLSGADGQLMVHKHDDFWQCMDTLRDLRQLEGAWQSGKAPWKVWT